MDTVFDIEQHTSNNIVDIIEAKKVTYDYNSHQFEVTEECDSSDKYYGTIRKILEFQTSHNIDDRKKLYSIVHKYIETHPLLIIPYGKRKRGGRRGQKYDLRVFDLNRIIKEELGIQVKSAYVVGLVQIVQMKIQNAVIGQSTYDFIENANLIEHALKEFNERQSLDPDDIIGTISELSKNLEPFHNHNSEGNGIIVDASLNSMTISWNNSLIECSYQSIAEMSLLEKMSQYDGSHINVNVLVYTSKRTNKYVINNIVESLTIKEHIEKLVYLLTHSNYLYAKRYYLTIQGILSKYLRNDRLHLLERIHKAFDKIQLRSSDYPIITLNFSQNSHQLISATSQKTYAEIRKQISTHADYYYIEEVLLTGINNPRIRLKEKSKLYELLYETHKRSGHILKAIEIYKMWIALCKETKIVGEKKICRMYTILSKLQATVKGCEEDAIASINKALEFEDYREFNLNLKEELLEKFKQSS